MLLRTTIKFILCTIFISGLQVNANANVNAFSNEKHQTPTKVKVGVLAYRGVEKAKQRWQPTVEYLNQRIQTHKFELVALNLQQINEYTANNKIDFVITNTGNYVTLAHKYGISRLATLINRTLDKTTMRFGAVIFTHRDNNSINTLTDLKAKSFIAVNKNGFGGFQMAWAEFRNHGIEPFEDFSEIKFSGFPQSQVVNAVLNKEFVAGTFRTDSLERLAASGKIDISKIKILNQQSDERFPFLYSTALFPEWPLSKLKYTSEELARKVAQAMLAMEETSEAAESAQISGWTIPLNYKPANDLMKNLNVGPYENLGKISFTQIVKEYWKWLLPSIVLFVLLAFLSFYIYCLNSTLRAVNQKLSEEVKKGLTLTNKLSYKATHDSLTKAYNRRAFKEFLERELQRCERHNKQFAILLVDVDDFKAVNDTYGHQTGDEYLIQLSQRMHHVLQKTDIFSRIGGDEFAILCFDTDKLNLDDIRNRILSISKAPYMINGVEIKVFFSVGTATYPKNGKTLKEMYIHADQDMYKNKKEKS